MAAHPGKTVRETVLVTGASGGIGLEIARCFAEAGSDLVLVARNTAKLAKAARSLESRHGVEVTAITCDLAGFDGAGQLIGEIADRGLGIDILVNNAGYGLSGPLAEADMDQQLDMLRLNIHALTELTGAFFPGMVQRGRGGVLNVSSMAGFSPIPFMAAYAASKAYVLSFSQALWEEARGTGVHVSCLCPGSTESAFHARAGTDKLESTQKVGMMPAAQVARIGYDGLRGNHRVVVPGVTNKTARRMLGALPTGLTLKILRRAFAA